MSTSLSDHPYLAGLYGDQELSTLLSAKAEIAAMLRFEAALALAESRLGIIPADAGPAIARMLTSIEIPPDSLADGTRAAGVPVPGLVSALRRQLGSPHGQFVHWGATSQDAIDSGLVLRLRDLLDILQRRLRRLVDLLNGEAARHAATPMAARTRSQIATPTTLGLRIATWAAPLARCLDRLDELRPRLLVVQLGGAAGTLSLFGDKGVALMEDVAQELGLGSPAKPWHSERDGLVELGNWLAMVSGLLARIAADLVLMGRSEAAELTAGSGGGSSTMPQKANPVVAETLVTLGRQNGALAGLMQQALIHVEERDGSAWAIEWATLPQMLVTTGAGLDHAIELAGSLRPATARMHEVMLLGGGALDAEALAFALARQMPLPEAQALVKAAAEAVAMQGGSLADHLAALCREGGFAPPEIDEAQTLAGAKALIDRVRTTGSSSR